MGFSPGPITATTRAVYLSKLRRLSLSPERQTEVRVQPDKERAAEGCTDASDK